MKPRRGEFESIYSVFERYMDMNPYRGGDIRSSRPKYFPLEERAQIDTRALLVVVILGVLTGLLGWRLVTLPPGALWFQIF